MRLINEGKAIEFDTFPSDDEFYCSWFVVPFDWFIRTFREHWEIEEPLKWLDKFYNEYTWDDTWLIYIKATEDKVVLREGDNR